MVIADIVGWVGTACLILGYGLVSARNKPPGLVYQTLNLVGAAGLLTNALFHGAWPVVALNAMWFAIGVVAIARILLVRPRTAETPERVAV